MRSRIALALCLIASLLGCAPALAQGSVPIAMQTVVDMNGKPIVGALLYFYQSGTVATRQDSFQDTALSQVNQWPLPSDAYGRLPMFYVASGTIHVRLLDNNGLQLFDYPNMLVLGPSGGGGGGGGTVDPTTIASTGDIKFRPTGETLTGWVRLNGNTIGSATSGASERANADTQNLFIYTWNNCSNSGCPVSTGRGSSGLADFNANKTIVLIDFRGFSPHGVDQMGNASPANRLTGALFGAPYSGNSTTPLSSGGEAAHTLTTAQLPVVTPTGSFTGNSVGITGTFSGTGQTWNLNQQTFLSGGSAAIAGTPTGFSLQTATVTVTPSGTISINSITPTGSITLNPFGSGSAHNVMSPFVLGTWYMKL